MPDKPTTADEDAASIQAYLDARATFPDRLDMITWTTPEDAPEPVPLCESSITGVLHDRARKGEQLAAAKAERDDALADGGRHLANFIAITAVNYRLRTRLGAAQAECAQLAERVKTLEDEDHDAERVLTERIVSRILRFAGSLTDPDPRLQAFRAGLLAAAGDAKIERLYEPDDVPPITQWPLPTPDTAAQLASDAPEIAAGEG